MTYRGRPIAVLTGDLVNSTALTRDQIAAAFSALAGAIADMDAQWQDVQPHVSRSRGDGWQIRIDRPRYALRAALLVRAALRAEDPALETRIAIATGATEADTPHDLNEATGPVFVASGRALDALSGAALMIHAAGGPLGAATRLADHISGGWTQAQAAAVYRALDPGKPTRISIAAALGKSHQAVSQALAAAGFPALENALELIEGTDD